MAAQIDPPPGFEDLPIEEKIAYVEAPAASDVLEASLAYELERPGLGFRFEDEVRTCPACSGRMSGIRTKPVSECGPSGMLG